MINWLKNLFTPKYSCDNLPKFQGAYPPMPKCKPPKQNISEPVYVIERSMFEHPSRWKVTKNIPATISYRSSTENYSIKDLKTKLEFRVIQTRSYGTGCRIHIHQSIYGIYWATEAEKEYLVKAVQTMQDKKIAQVERIYQMKKNKERQRLMEIYK